MEKKTPWMESLYLREKVAQYAAVVLIGLSIVGLAVVIASGSQPANQMGVALQFLGGLSALPEVIGWKFKSSAHSENFTRAYRWVNVSFHGYASLYLPLMLGNLTTSLVMVWLLAEPVLRAALLPGLWEMVLRPGLGVFGFAWLNSWMMCWIYELAEAKIPRWFWRAFCLLDTLMSIPAVAASAMALILIRWLAAALRFLYGGAVTGPRRALLLVSFPCYLTGLLLEWIATWI